MPGWFGCITIASATVWFGTPLGVKPTGLLPPSGPSGRRKFDRAAGPRLHEAGVGVGFDQDVVGQPAATGEGADVGQAVGERRVLPDDADRHRGDEHQRHEAGGQRDGRGGQRARHPTLAAVTRCEVQPRSVQREISTNSAKNIVLTLIPAILGIAALNGTP